MRAIPVALQNELDTNTPFITRCLRIRLQNGQEHGLTQLDRDVVYDHGDGPITYKAATGFDPSAIESDVSYSVTNAQAKSLVAGSTVNGINADEIEAGVLDDATWVMYVVNFREPTTGTAMILDAGDIGEVKLKDDVWFGELLSYSMRLSQPVGSVWQRSCRAIYGSPRNSPDMLGCGYDASGDWADFTVTEVAPENNRTFTIAANDPTPYGFFPGRVEWYTGENVGTRQYATEQASGDSSGSTISLMDTVPYAVQVGDTGRIRSDCPKTPEACKARNNYINYNGEDHTPVGDAVTGTTPGAGMPGGGGYVGGGVPQEAQE